MTKLEWKEVEPEQDDWEKQIDIVAYYHRRKHCLLWQRDKMAVSD